MAFPKELLIDPVPHPTAEVRRAGFDLDDPYVERVWVSVIGPSCTLLLRRLPAMWQREAPARVDVTDFATSLGLSQQSDGLHSQIWRMLRRLERFGFATRADDRGRIGVYARIGPLPDWRLARLSESTSQAHDDLLGDHLDRLARESAGGPPSGRSSPAADISQRLKVLERRPPAPEANLQ